MLQTIFGYIAIIERLVRFVNCDKSTKMALKFVLKRDIIIELEKQVIAVTLTYASVLSKVH